MKRLLVTGDVLRPQDDAFRPAQTGNILWLHRRLSRSLAEACGLVAEPLVWGEGGFDAAAFYEAAGTAPDIEGWVTLFDAPELPREAAAILVETYCNAGAVIGFELAEVQKRLLNIMNVPWIDLNIHPYRFGPDVLFAVQTNHQDVLDALRRHHVEDTRFHAWADHTMATAVKMPPIAPVEEACLVVGQTRIDRSLIAEGRLLDLRDFASPLHRLIGRTGRVLFKPHPYNADGFGIHDIGLPLRRIREAQENVYVLLSQPSLRQVIGVSSSVIAEARFFGKEGVFLGEPPFRIAPTRGTLALGMHASLLPSQLCADLWRDLLAPILPVTGRDGVQPLPLGDNALRNSLRQYWGYDEIAFQLLFDLAARRAEERRGR